MKNDVLTALQLGPTPVEFEHRLQTTEMSGNRVWILDFTQTALKPLSTVSKYNH